MDSIYEELENIFQNFRWIDDIPEDQYLRDKICLEARAALLLEANCASERFPAFVRNAVKSFTNKNYQLPEAITIQHEIDSYNGTMAYLTCNTFETGKLNYSGKYWGPVMSHTADYAKREIPQCSVKYEPHPMTWDQKKDEQLLINFCDKIKQAFYEKYPTLYSICKDLTPYSTPEQICRYWGAVSTPWSKIKPRGMYPDYIWGTDELQREEKHEGWTDARLEQFTFQFLIPCQHADQGSFALSNRYYDNWYCQVFPFHNEYGETIMNVIKVYDKETQCKILLPLTTWIRNNFHKNQIFCVPYPEDKTPLYNLDLLLKPECRTVILCDSIELADANQKNVDSAEIVFTSFICSPGKYDQVDWSPLQDKELFVLVSNNSGISLESAALKTRELIEFLSENTELQTQQLLVMPVEYETKRMRGFEHVDDILKMYGDYPPQSGLDDLLILTDENEIEEFFQKAEAKINKLPEKWWLKQDVPPEEKRIMEEKSSKPQPIDYVMRPLLVRGEVSMLYAGLKVGKSNFAYSIAARIVAAGYSSRPVQLLSGKWWAVPEKIHKVLYLDFENKGEMENKKSSFQEEYFPKGKEQECRSNLIMEDCSMLNIDFSAFENHQRLLDMLKDAKQNKGTPGKAVDLLVIDTYTAFVRGEGHQTPANFKALMNKIRDMHIAILIVHHTNSENKARGFQSKKDSFYMTLNLSCDKEEPEGDVTEQARILKYEDPREVMGGAQKKPFKIKFDSAKHQWYIVDNIDENQELLQIVEDYKKCKFDRAAICQMVGLEKSAYSERLKKAKEKK